MTAKSDATIEEVSGALAEHLRTRLEGPTLQVSRTGESLDPSATLGQVDLVSGDEVAVVEAPTTRLGSGTDTQAVLVLRTGPQAGERIEIARTITIGRDESADVAIRDALISRRHMSVAPAADNSVVVTDVGSSNGTIVNGSLISGPTMVGNGDVITIGATELVVQLASSLRRASARRNDGLVSFSRPPRVAPEPIDREIRFPTPPEEVEARKIPLVATLAPLVLSGAMAYFVGPIMLVFALVSPLMMLANRWEDKRSGKAGFERAMKQYSVDVEEAVSVARTSYERSFSLRVDAQPGVTEALSRISTLDPRIWERRAEQRDFLALRLGTSDQQSLLSIIGGPQRDDERSFAVSANAFIDSVLVDKDAPHLVNLMSSPALGVVGRSSARTDLMSWLTLQAAAQCSPYDLAICIVAPGAPEWSWASWLPHTRVIPLDSSFARSVALDEDDSRA
ncbi:MAG: FHA domain-containing protein, partial [Ilumatobacteraceae bacterium]